jgi:hypothetical protein
MRSVWSRVGAGHAGRAAGIEAGEQDGGFHLRAGHRQRVVDAVQGRVAVDHDRRQPAAGIDACAHLAQWTGDALHRPLHQRTVADQRGRHALPGQQAHRQAHGRAGVAHVERMRGGLQAAAAGAVHTDDIVLRALDAHAQRLQGGHRGEAVGAVEEAGRLGDAFGQSAQHQRTVRDRLVAGHADGAVQMRGWFDQPGGCVCHDLCNRRESCARKRSLCSGRPIETRRCPGRP